MLDEREQHGLVSPGEGLVVCPPCEQESDPVAQSGERGYGEMSHPQLPKRRGQRQISVLSRDPQETGVTIGLLSESVDIVPYIVEDWRTQLAPVFLKCEVWRFSRLG